MTLENNPSPAMQGWNLNSLTSWTCAQGEADTTDYRVFLQQEGRDVSTWHDVPLRNEDGTLNFVCEIPKDTSAKMEVATVRYLGCALRQASKLPLHGLSSTTEASVPADRSDCSACQCRTEVLLSA